MDRNGMVPHSWLKKCMMMFPVAENMQKVSVKNSMENWKTEMMSGRQNWGTVRKRRGKYQEISSLLSNLALIPMSLS